ncbi:hypothetical protein OIU77_021879 [Salix suchowensis]|uniref:Uncharacterized protein n=1 Tax=Salix suchowensis TaxID=1278906 RepID=A0ABQ9CDB4_9ROSI|nr:hypothetical protein OIU77_021879 [Salix suchowensis]
MFLVALAHGVRKFQWLQIEIVVNHEKSTKHVVPHILWLISGFSKKIFEEWSDSKKPVLPIYRKLIARGLKIWVYSGDTDGGVSVLSTRYSLSSLGLPITRTWRPWYHQKQVSGWFQEYEGLTFATFRGAGHAVPIFKPSDSLAFFSAFLLGEPLPSER